MSNIPTTEKITRKILNDYKKQFRKFLMTTRFSNDTWNENENYRNRNKKIGCIYCSPEPISKEIPIDSVLFILEMNNDINKILGLGMVRNHAICGKYNVYDNGNYNRYVYTGKYRISRQDMSQEEEEIMKFFDILCFTGSKHMKRGQGMKTFPIDVIYKCSKRLDLVEYISQMFKKRLVEKKELTI